jgi:hypothetical protein
MQKPELKKNTTFRLTGKVYFPEPVSLEMASKGLPGIQFVNHRKGVPFLGLPKKVLERMMEDKRNATGEEGHRGPSVYRVDKDLASRFGYPSQSGKSQLGLL